MKMDGDTDKGVLKIGIISGKGGVGKTTLSGSLSCIFHDYGYRIIAADCDVDAPNLGLLFKTDKILDGIEVKTTEKAIFDKDKCIGCKRCIDEEFCQFDALFWDEEKNKPKIDELACEGCGACMELCPVHAFTIQPVVSGKIVYERSVFGFPLVWGETVLGATTSGKLVTEIKKYIEKINEDVRAEVIILDGPPGIGCPVVATVGDLDYVIVVMEPTPTALHDAERAIMALIQMRKKFGIVLNKSTAWNEGVDKIKVYADEHGFKILGYIPVDENIGHATVKGLPVYRYNPDCAASRAIKDIFEDLKGIIGL